ncbi:hypothetical protein PanWU01x14_005510 [Parasponia andersonii]|uniref:RNase H type-1 domain-containing protein n=1 Tax=Parasponia andersonii TaxID=3476 RepID=A0A2P5E3I3_PARAD|nr:hypothetical protein PanWU01x14_005510 [Parasponia andersonii]
MASWFKFVWELKSSLCSEYLVFSSVTMEVIGRTRNEAVHSNALSTQMPLVLVQLWLQHRNVLQPPFGNIPLKTGKDALAVSLKISHLILEGDSLVAIQSLTLGPDLCQWEISNIIFDRCKLLECVSVWSASHISRKSNFFAHNTAKCALLSLSFGRLDFSTAPNDVCLDDCEWTN